MAALRQLVKSKFQSLHLLEHIVDVDGKYGPFLESHGGRFIS
jgi:hypothetical protein